MVAYILIAAAAALWGSIAIFVKGLSAVGFTPMEIVTIRVTLTALILFIYGIVRYPDQLKIKIVDLKLFIGTGIFSIVFFNWCYFTTMNEMNISLAVILLYTSPAFITILSIIFLKESLSKEKVVAVIVTIIGCIFIAGFSETIATDVTKVGIMIGLGAGLGYALYSIFGKFALMKYSSFTVTYFTFFVSAVFLLPLTQLWNKGALFIDGMVAFNSFGLALIPTVIAYILYTKGLEKIESSQAGVLATIEPVVATFIGVLMFGEILSIYQIIGALLILSAVVLVSLSNNKPATTLEKYPE